MVEAVYYVFVLIFMFSDSELSSAAGDEGDNCPPFFECGNLGNLSYPYTTTQYKRCGIFPIHGCDNHNPNATKTVQLINGRKQFQVRGVEQEPLHFSISVKDEQLENLLVKSSCELFGYDIDLPRSSAVGYYYIRNNITLYKCNRTLPHIPSNQFYSYNISCANKSNETIYFRTQNIPDDYLSSSAACSKGVQLPVNSHVFSGNPFNFIAAEFPIEFQFSDDCHQCYSERSGECRLDSKGKFLCFKPKEDKRHRPWKLLGIGLGVGLGVGGWIVVLGLILLRHYRQKCVVSHVRLRSANDANLDSGRLFFGVPIFSYKELQEATNNFHPSRKLGDGGFGSVYYGILQDGRQVAVKHLFNQNYKRVEQFMNEVEILTRLRHTNLVSLYGCTSHQSRELLLVYEYIPNGTVATHLRGKTANPALLTWPIRLKIAIETATALAYLHASDVIHRDVKTNNILLDNNFTVKVADFGLSRLFPNDVSHVSTAPQGTPGYVDPEYHYCFQLTNKSDVYSFGVVLIELISCMPAVDIGRERDEIALGNLAVRKIQRGELEDMVDPCLGIEKDSEVKRMVVSVGEMAFQCLQREKELRPSIDKVLEVLKRIESGGDDAEEGGVSEGKVDFHNPGAVSSLKWDQVRMLKNMKSPSSPNSVAEKWKSDSTTPNVSV
ncbi:LEAF RUST 10 DISEASE-RESISTANCE LOCUS RECEPTOR-LIKE PROTEIN KINASE-like 1.1 [Senna tora]|uniref:LEAF RUST 10 DISEASE-RESISTANCE LOCUS RECEPTOR-LIKE PROTEIN KINASE-like 1.1 n=1 Tax=Senna tora TaxID=362788 RepID=A0A834W450_9FABA|nr:LEAF RUST 10 DISEASE-RESISTANCE LOCUS RECEPTOR-LIKE PROTEIN KINASE-like 1.1 [Senna tora]